LENIPPTAGQHADAQGLAHKTDRTLRKGAVWVGTSGWTYDSWRGPFYPPDVPKKAWLTWYSSRFASAEVNFSFYRTPSLETVRGRREQTPDPFLFAWKASKFITHWKRLNAHTCQNSLDLMATRLRALGGKVGPVLFQLPPQFEANPEHNVALCISDHHQAAAPWTAPANHVYIRGHGPDGRYKNSYTDAALKNWAENMRKWHRQGKVVFAFFDNDQKSAAPLDAQRLMAMLGIGTSDGSISRAVRSNATASSRP
jgi:uncharacterized protein YecE (DUF72 family)